MARVWVLNFDADDELAAPGRYRAPTAAVAARFAELATRVGPLLAAGDRPILALAAAGASAEVPEAADEGWAFCPTASARRRLLERGVTPIDAPAIAILRQANDRAFAAGLGLGAARSHHVYTASDVTAHLRAEPRVHDWLLKRAFGFAGRGRRKVLRELTESDERWIDASLRDGDGLTVEPFVTIERDVGLHGWIPRAGPARYGRLTVQACTKEGAWIETRLAAAGELTAAEARALEEAAARAAASLADAGYFGPFGIDGYRTTDGAFVALSDLNARFSMGWATGFGGPPPPL